MFKEQLFECLKKYQESKDAKEKEKTLKEQKRLLKKIKTSIAFIFYDIETNKIGIYNDNMSNTGYILVDNGKLINVTENAIDARIVASIIDEINNLF